jgi:hypothetical protein
LNEQRFGVRFLAGVEVLPFPTASKLALGFSQPLSLWTSVVLSGEVKRPGGEAEIHHLMSILRLLLVLLLIIIIIIIIFFFFIIIIIILPYLLGQLVCFPSELTWIYGSYRQ